MTKSKRKLRDYCDLTEHRKDKILEYIRVKGLSIKNAALYLGVTYATINKIFTERYGKRDKKMKQLKQ